MTDNKDNVLDELENVTAGLQPDINEDKTRKSPQGLTCYLGKRGFNYSSPICASVDFACELYDSCRNPEKAEK